MADKTNYDLVIIGGGPAAMTAVVYAARKQVDMLVISDDIGGQTMWSSGVENYLGFPFITGAELVQKFEDHVRTFNVPQEYTRATRLARSGDVFNIDTQDGRQFTSRAVIIATGKSPKMLNVAGEKEFLGRGVTYCATCDGPVFAGQNVAVVGGGNSGLDAVVQMMKICPRVYLIERSQSPRADAIMIQKAKADPNVEILTNTTVKEIVGGNFVEGLVIDSVDGGNLRKLDVSAVFVEIGLSPNTDFLNGIVRLNQNKEIPVDCAARTGIPGLFAAGDVTDVPEKQIIIAAGDGAKAALGAYAYLVRLPVGETWG
ncbi:MAG: FAD-dependent oxidoreductase [Armatimonadetes bacterium]|jgi:alkyl hydroperoxide reductase subunit F|nr:FAD-dependent oxidoreductase [Armatimonadota bacterium]